NMTGANLGASGSASVSADLLVLQGSGISDSPALYFEGTTALDVVFGDGKRCAGGAIVVLGVKQNVSGASRLGPPNDAPISSRRPDNAGEVRYYQCWYRNNAGPCGSGSNLTNGLAVTWG